MTKYEWRYSRDTKCQHCEEASERARSEAWRQSLGNVRRWARNKKIRRYAFTLTLPYRSNVN